MMLRSLLLALILAAAVPQASEATVYSVWTVGQEREIEPGNYARLLRQENGWRLWRFETRQGVTCHAVKSAVGRPHPYPLGVGTALYGGSPYLAIYFGHTGATSATLHGRHYGGRREYRRPGDRFWSDFTHSTDLAELDGARVEVHVLTWEYPEIMVGMADERGIIDLTGLSAIVAAGRECAGALQTPAR
jgi:hypothetical protein